MKILWLIAECFWKPLLQAKRTWFDTSVEIIAFHRISTYWNKHKQDQENWGKFDITAFKFKTMMVSKRKVRIGFLGSLSNEKLESTVKLLNVSKNAEAQRQW